MPEMAVDSTNYGMFDTEGLENSCAVIRLRESENCSEEADDSSSASHSGNEGDTEQPENLDASDTERNGGKDSGIDCGGSSAGSDDGFVEPDNELMEKVIAQVEFYFSDANILKDSFLLKHVRRNKEGFVSLKLIASFRKVKTLTKNWKVVAYCLKRSSKLQLNEEGTKVRRTEPLPEYDETTPSRTVVGFNLPFEKPTVENTSELFSKCGEIVLVRILRPGAAVPSDIKKFLHKHPEIGATVCALVEFENHESAMKAIKELGCANTDWRSSMHVIPLSQKGPKKPTNSTPSNQEPPKSPVIQNGQTAQQKPSELITRDESRKPTKPKRKGKRQNRVDELKASEGEYASSGSDNEMGSPCFPRRRSSGSFSTGYLSSSPQRSDSFSFGGQRPRCGSASARLFDRSSPEFNRKSPLVRQKSYSLCGDSDGAMSPTSTGSPWVQRRLLAAKEAGNQSTSPLHNTRTLIPENVIRLPRGPDGTNGFHWNKNPAAIGKAARSQSAPSPLAVVC